MIFRNGSKRETRDKGFSLVELVTVLAIVLIIAGITIPSMVQAWYDLQLRSSVGQVSSLFQQARIMAAKNNATYPVRFRVNGQTLQMYIDTQQNSTLDPVNDPFLDLPRGVTAAAGAPTGGSGQPTAFTLAGDTTSGTPFDNSNVLAFTPRGLPCNYVSGSPATCTTPAASYFVFYFNNGRANGWVGVYVTKTGRSQLITWDGSAWH
jgi:prepilin-type N-terminal cleavage/methylation domain-containing protein